MTDLRGIGVTTLSPLGRRTPEQHRSIQIVFQNPDLGAQPATDRGADHDLAAVRTIAQDMYVMKSGRVVEKGRASEIVSAPRHDYTQRLRGSVLEPDPHAVEELHVS